MEASTSTFTPKTPLPFPTPRALDVNDRTPSMECDLVVSLRNRLSASRSTLRSWVEEQKAICDTVSNRYEADRSTFQAQIDSKSQSVLAWRIEKGLSVSGNDETQSREDPCNNNQKGEENSLQNSICVLKEKVNLQRDKLEALKRDEQAREEDPAAEPLDDLENPTYETFEELQSIIKGYQDLSGLSFEKAENERLRFSFKGLNPENRDQQCSFLLSTTNDDFYLVEQCEPPIPEEELGDLIKDLNNSEDLGRFFQRIRRLWTETVLSVQGGSSP